jgi:hypothetical protein
MSLMNPLFRHNLSTFVKRNLRNEPNDATGVSTTFEGSAQTLLPKEQFRRILLAEKKRAERTGKNLLLLLLDRGQENRDQAFVLLSEAAGSLGRVLRDTDITGWFEGNRVLGVIFTEFGTSDLGLAAQVIEKKVTRSLQQSFPAEPLRKFRISFYAFPEDWAGSGKTTQIRPQVEVSPRGSGLREASSFSRVAIANLASKAAL